MTDTSTSVKTKPALTQWQFSVYILLVLIGAAIVSVFGWWWFALSNVPQNFEGVMHGLDFILFALLSYVVWYQICNELLTWVNALFMRHPVPMEPAKNLKVALLTAFVPSKEPIDVLENTIIAMKAVRYPHDTWVLDEGNDSAVRILCKKHKVNHFSRFGIEKYNTPDGHFKARTKAGNYNSWFDSHSHEYEIVAQHDVDFVPSADYFEKTLGYFKDEKVAFVGTPQIYGNVNESWIARGAAEQAYGFYGPLQKGLFGLGMHLFIGANHVIRTSAHDSIGGYSGHIVEDHLTGMRLYAQNWKGVYVPEALLIGEGPATWDAYFSQQMRWAYGLIDILFRHSPKIVTKMKKVHGINYLLLQQYYFFGLAQIIGVFLMGVFFIFGIQSGVMDLTTLLILYPSFLLIQIAIYLWLQLSYINPKEESGFHIAGKVLNIAAWPIYLLAFFSALAGKKLNYQVTPKGSAQEQGSPHIGMFSIHFVIGTLMSALLLVSMYTEFQTPLLVFWALVTIVSMYFFVCLAATQRAIEGLRKYSNTLRVSPVAAHIFPFVVTGGLFLWAFVVLVNVVPGANESITTSEHEIVTLVVSLMEHDSNSETSTNDVARSVILSSN